MIERPTVLILGAGASAPYGFPTGPRLKNLICSQQAINAMINYVSALQFTKEQYLAFIDKLKKGSAKSIDAFLEKNPDLIRVGKSAIAKTLIEFEKESKLLPPEAPEADWYFELGSNLLSRGPDHILNNRLTIITYNYDRSLEHRLALMLCADHNVTLIEATALVARLPIIHCHGTLGSLIPGAQNYRAYEVNDSPEAVSIAANSIQIIHEADGGCATFTSAIQALKEAERIYFLGFGYHPLNMRRLGITGAQQYPWSKTTKLFVNCIDNFERYTSWLKESYGFEPSVYNQYYAYGVEQVMTRYLDLT